MIPLIVALFVVISSFLLSRWKAEYGLAFLIAIMGVNEISSIGFILNGRLPYLAALGFILADIAIYKRDPLAVEFPLRKPLLWFLLVAIVASFQSYAIPTDAVVTMGSTWNMPWIKSVTRVFLLWLMIATYAIASRYIKKPSTFLSVTAIVALLIVVGYILVSVSSYSYIMKSAWSIGPHLPFIQHHDEPTRWRGFFSEPSLFANFLIAITPLLVAPLFFSKKKGLWVLSILSILISCAALLFSGSRGAWIALAGGIFFGLVLYGLKLRSPAFIPNCVTGVMILGIIAALVILRLPEPFVQVYLENPFEGVFGSNYKFWSTETRLIQADYALDAFKAHPLLGVGYDNYNFHSGYKIYEGLTENPINWAEPNNLPLKVLAELGIIGFIVFLWLVFKIIHLLRAIIVENTFGYGFILVVALSSLMVHTLFISKIHYVHLWIALAIVTAFADKNVYKEIKARRLDV